MAGINQVSTNENEEVEICDAFEDSYKQAESAERYVIVPAEWPYQEWKTVKQGMVSDEKVKHEEHFERTLSSHTPNSGLNGFLEIFERDLQVFEQEHDHTLRKEVAIMLEETVENLQKSQPLFQSCRLIPAGSVAEGTKVASMDEFDYLLVLNRFCDEEIFKVHLHKDFTLILLENNEKSEHIRETHPNMIIEDEENDKLRLVKIRSILINILMAEFHCHMRPG